MKREPESPSYLKTHVKRRGVKEGGLDQDWREVDLEREKEAELIASLPSDLGNEGDVQDPGAILKRHWPTLKQMLESVNNRLSVLGDKVRLEIPEEINMRKRAIWEAWNRMTMGLTPSPSQSFGQGLNSLIPHVSLVAGSFGRSTSHGQWCGRVRMVRASAILLSLLRWSAVGSGLSPSLRRGGLRHREPRSTGTASSKSPKPLCRRLCSNLEFGFVPQ